MFHRLPLKAPRSALWALLSLLAFAPGCAYDYREGASKVASSRQAASRDLPNPPPLEHGLEVRAPSPAGEPLSVPWAEVEGRIGTADLFEADAVIALDMSTSVNFPSGLDLDEDGVVGEVRGVVRAIGSYDGRGGHQGEPPPLPAPQWTTDVDDTVAALELAAARALIAGLARRENRIGIMSYAERGNVRSEVGSADAAREALDGLRPASGGVGTDIYAALRRARDMLEEAPELAGFPRQRAVLLFTDGQPVEPVNPYIARRRAQQAADDLAQAGIDLYVFTFGSIGVEQAKFLVELAGSGEGRLHRVGAPERMLADLPSIDLTPVWLRIENASTGKSAEGIETRSNGHFSGFVPLEPGENELRVLVERGDGQLQRWVGTVVLAPDAADGDPGSRQAAIERVQREIEQRTRRPDAAAGPPPPEPR